MIKGKKRSNFAYEWHRQTFEAQEDVLVVLAGAWKEINLDDVGQWHVDVDLSTACAAENRAIRWRRQSLDNDPIQAASHNIVVARVTVTHKVPFSNSILHYQIAITFWNAT